MNYLIKYKKKYNLQTIRYWKECSLNSQPKTIQQLYWNDCRLREIYQPTDLQ